MTSHRLGTNRCGNSWGPSISTPDSAADAERVYREDLETFPDNGWSLFGLQQSLEAQGKTAEAEEIAEQFAAAWQYADVELTASRL